MIAEKEKTVEEVCDTILDLEKNGVPNKWKTSQACAPDGSLTMSKKQRVKYMLEMEPDLGKLFYIETKDMKNQEVVVAYTGFHNTGLGICFLRNNMSRVAKECKAAIKERDELIGALKKIFVMAKNPQSLDFLKIEAICKDVIDETES